MEDPGDDLGGREASLEVVGAHPVGRAAAAVQEAGLPQHHRPGAHREHPRAPVDGATEHLSRHRPVAMDRGTPHASHTTPSSNGESPVALAHFARHDTLAGPGVGHRERDELGTATYGREAA